MPSYQEIFTMVRNGENLEYKLVKNSKIPFVALDNVTSALDELGEREELKDTFKADLGNYKIWRKIKKSKQDFVDAFSKFENNFLIVAMMNYETCIENLQELTNQYELIKDSKDPAFMTTFTAIYNNLLDKEDGDDIKITNEYLVWQNGKIISQIGRLFGAMFVNFSAVSFRLKILMKQLSSPFCHVYSAQEWTSDDTQKRSGKKEFELIRDNILMSVEGFDKELIDQMNKSVSGIKEIAEQQLKIVQERIEQEGEGTEYDSIKKILDKILKEQLDFCRKGIEQYTKIIELKMCFIEALAEHNFKKLKGSQIEAYKMSHVTVFEDDDKITRLRQAWEFFMNQKQKFIFDVGQNIRTYDDYLSFQKTVMFPIFLNNVDPDISLWNSLNGPHDREHFEKLTLLQKHTMVSYRSLIDYQVIMSLAFATSIGPNVKQPDWNASRNSDPRLLILSPTGTGKSDIYYQTVSNIQMFDTSGKVYVLVKRSTLRDQFFGMKTCPMLLRELDPDRLQEVTEAKSREELLKILDDDSDVKNYKNLDDEIEQMQENQKSVENLVKGKLEPKKINFISTVNPYFVKSKYSTKTKIALEQILEESSILIIDEVDDLIEQGIKYEKEKERLNDEDVLEEKVKEAVEALDNYKKEEYKYMEKLQNFYIVRMECAYQPGFYLEDERDKDTGSAEIAKLTPPGLNACDDISGLPKFIDLLTKYDLQPSDRSRSQTNSKPSELDQMFIRRGLKNEKKVNKHNNTKFDKQAKSFQALINDKDLPETYDEQKTIVNEYKKKLEAEFKELRALQDKADQLEFYLVGETYVSLREYIEGKKKGKCQGLIGLTATYGSADVMKEMFTMFRRVSDDANITDFEKYKDKISNMIDEFTLTDNSSNFSEIIKHCGFKTYNYTDMIQALKEFEKNQPMIGDLMNLVSYVAMYKPNNLNGKQRDDVFGRMFPVIELFKDEGFEPRGKYFSHPELVQIRNKNTGNDEAEKFKNFADAAVGNINTIVKKSKKELPNFPNKVLIIVRNSFAKQYLIEALEKENPFYSLLGKNSFEDDFKLFQNDEGNESKVMVATYKDGGRGVDYKNVRVLIKMGFFNYAENTQINGRINRIKSISHESLSPEEMQKANEVKMYFMIPSTDTWDGQLFKTPERVDRINCYMESFRLLVTQQRYYNEFMMFLSKSSFISSAIQDRMLMNPKITYEMKSP